MERLSGSMSALDKIKKLTEQLESGEEEVIQKFKEDFEEFEKEYDKIPWHILSSEDVEEPHLFFSEQKLCQVNVNGEWEDCKDGKISLRNLTAHARQVDGRQPIDEQPVKTSIDHLPINIMVEEIKDKALRNTKDGLNKVYSEFVSISYNDVSDRQEYELLKVLYEKLGETFNDTLSLSIAWKYDSETDYVFMVINMEW